MYSSHKIFKIEKTNGLPLWRYMDLWKFLDLMNSNELYFPSVDSLGDQHEGRLPQAVYNSLKHKYGENNAEDYKATVERLRSEILVSSWTARKQESFAMWKMYAKDKLGIAIKTSYGKLKNSFNETNEIIYIGEVNYFDEEKFKEDEKFVLSNTFFTFLNKIDAYLFENEIRCIIDFGVNGTITNKKIKIDLKELIEEVYISPFANNVGLVEIIESLKEKKKLSFNVKISSLNDTWL